MSGHGGSRAPGLPRERQLIHGRTHSRSWDAAEYYAIQVIRPRARLTDRLWWLASAVLLLGTAWLIWS